MYSALPESRDSRNRRRNHHTKADEIEEAWVAPVAGRRARELISTDERAAAQYMCMVAGNIFILSTIIRLIRVTLEYGMCPFPDIASHVGHAVWTVALWRIGSNGSGIIFATFIYIALIFFKGIAPRVVQRICTACGFFPLSFGGQAQNHTQRQFVS